MSKGISRYSQSEQIWYLNLKVKGLENRVASFESGSAYVNLAKQKDAIINEQAREIKELKEELADARKQIVTNRNRFFEATDDLSKEHIRECAKKDRRIAELEARVLEVERARDASKDEETKWRRKYYEVASELEEEKGKNQKLTAQVNMDFENSSIPSSSQGAGRKKVHNSREKSDRKPGGQIGHEGHMLQQQKATETIPLPDPEEYVNDPDYYATEDVVRRQKIIVTIGVTVREYTATVFRNRKTGSRVHAEFPKSYETDISYDASVKGLAFLLSNFGNMSAGKICETLKEVSHGKIQISKATVLGLCQEFSKKSKAERQKIVRELMTSPVMNADFTNANIDGKGKQVLILASPSTNATLFIARDHKGHKGVQGTPLENYVGAVVHDHDKTFYKYGTRHQECMQHNIRYTIGSEQNEPEREWNGLMHKLIQEMIHYRNGLGDSELDPGIVEDFEKRYDDILATAKKEYDEVPASDYYKEGYNLYLRLVEFKEAELLFLHDKRVPANNSLAERLARIFKRKQKQMIVIRSDDNFHYLCDSLSVISTFRYQHQREDSLYDKVCEVLSREKPRKPRYIPNRSNKRADA